MQIAKLMFHMNLSIMKKILDLIEFKMDKRTSEYKFMKKQVMDYFYESLKKRFKQLSDEKIIEHCSCGANLRKGYKPCKDCGGCGFRNTKDKS